MFFTRLWGRLLGIELDHLAVFSQLCFKPWRTHTVLWCLLVERLRKGMKTKIRPPLSTQRKLAWFHSFSLNRRGGLGELGCSALLPSAVNSGKYKSPRTRIAVVHTRNGGCRVSFNYSQGTERMSSHSLFFYNFPNNDSSNCFCWNPWPPVFSLSSSLRSTHTSELPRPQLFCLNLMKVWFLPLRSFKWLN